MAVESSAAIENEGYDGSVRDACGMKKVGGR